MHQNTTSAARALAPTWSPAPTGAAWAAPTWSAWQRTHTRRRGASAARSAPSALRPLAAARAPFGPTQAAAAPRGSPFFATPPTRFQAAPPLRSPHPGFIAESLPALLGQLHAIVAKAGDAPSGPQRAMPLRGLRGTLKVIASLGYNGVEMAGCRMRTPEGRAGGRGARGEFHKVDWARARCTAGGPGAAATTAGCQPDTPPPRHCPALPSPAPHHPYIPTKAQRALTNWCARHCAQLLPSSGHADGSTPSRAQQQ